MRKELLYSMLAAAAFPAMAHADAVIKDAVNIQNWKGTGASYDAVNSVFVSPNGSAITYSLGMRVPGTYKLSIQNIDASNGAVTVTVAGQTKTTAAKAGESVDIEFTLTAETDVNITATIAGNAASFSVGSATLTLVNDFQDKIAVIQRVLTDVTNEIKGWGDNGFTDESTYNGRTAVIQSHLDAITKDEDGSLNGYKYYADYKIYGTVDDSNGFITETRQVEADASAAFEAQIAKLLTDVTSDTQYTTLVSNHDALTDAQKEQVAEDWDVLQQKISDYQASVKNKTAISGYEAAIAEIKSAISTLGTKVKGLAGANIAAYNAIKAAVENAQNTRTTYLSDLTTALPTGKLSDGSDNGYNQLLTAGRKVISDLFAKLEQVNAANETFKSQGIADQKKDELITEVRDLGTQLDDAQTLYKETLKNALDKANATYIDEVTLQSHVENLFKDVIANHAKEKDALEAAVEAVKAAIDAANSGDSKAIETLDLTEQVAAVETAVENLTTACAGEQSKADAVAKANTEIGKLNDALAEAKEAVAALKYGDTVAETTYWKTWASGIESQIEALDNTANEKAADSKVGSDDEFYTKTLPTTLTSITSAITTYKEQTAKAAENYNFVKPAVDKYKAALAEAKAKVTSLNVYTDKTYNKDSYDYKANVEAEEAKIKAAETAISNALKLQDAKNAAAVIALSYDSTAVVAVINHIGEQAQADQAEWQKNADAKALAAQKAAIKVIASELDTKRDKVQKAIDDTTRPLGKATEAIKEEFDKVVFPTAEEVNAVTSDETKDATKVSALYSKISTANDAMTDILKDYDAAVASVKANNEAKATADDAVSTVRTKLDNAGLETILGDALAKGKLSPTTESDSIAAIKTSISKAIEAAKDAIGQSYSDETLASDYASKFSVSIDIISKVIDASKVTAEYLNKNYTSWTEQTAALSELNAAIAAAQSAAQAADANAGKSYYSDQLLGKTYTSQAENIGNAITDNYNGITSVTSEPSVTASINDLTALVNAVEQDAKDNLTSYNNLVDAKNEALKTWNEQAVKLAGAVETSKLNDYQNEMDGYLADLNKISANIDSVYNIGQAKAKETDYTSELTKLEGNITSLVNKATDPESVNAQIEQDNAGMLDAIKKAKKASDDAYANAVTEVNKYKNLKSTEAQAALEDVKEAFDNVNTDLAEKPTEISNTFTEANAKYKEITATAGVVFDKDSSYVRTFNEYTEEINDELEDFLTAASKALNDAADATLKGYESEIATAKGDIAVNYTLTENDDKAKVFDEVSKVVADARDAITAADVQTLDNKLEYLKDNFESDKTAAIDKAAGLDLDGYISKAEADVKKGEAYLADDAETLAKYKATVANTVAKARTDYGNSKSLSAEGNKDYDAIKALVDAYNASNEYKTAVENNAKYEALVNVIDSQQSKLNASLASVDDYVAKEALKNIDGGFNDLQNELDGYKADAESARKTGNGWPSEEGIKAVGADAENLADTAKDKTLYTQEQNYLAGLQAEVTAAYNVWATKNPDDATAEKTAIDKLFEDIENANDATVLLTLQSQVKAELAKLSSDTDKQASTDKLNEALDAVKTTFADGTLPEVQTQYQDEMDALQAEKSGIASEISGNANIVFNEASIATKIGALKDKADDLADEVAAANAKQQEANEKEAAAATALQDKVAALNKRVADSKAKLDSYENAKARSNMFGSKYKLVTDRVAQIESTVNAAVEAKNAQSTTINPTDIQYVDDLLKQIEDLAAYREATYQLDNLETTFTALQEQVGGLTNDTYLPADLKAIQDALTPINEAIYGKKDADGNVITPGIVQDIQSDYTSSQSDENYDGEKTSRKDEIAAQLEAIQKVKDLIKSSVISPEGDVTGDGKVDVNDLTAVLDHLDTTDAAYDINDDGVVDVNDLTILIDNISQE